MAASKGPSMKLPRISPLLWLGWLLGALIVFGALEATALWNSAPNDSLTRTIVRFVPWPVALGIWALLAGAALWHWGTEYRRRSGR
jgi:hypothetical protein